MRNPDDTEGVKYVTIICEGGFTAIASLSNLAVAVNAYIESPELFDVTTMVGAYLHTTNMDNIFCFVPKDKFEKSFTFAGSYSNTSPTTELSLSSLLDDADKALKQEHYRLDLLVATPANDSEIIVVFGFDNIQTKMQYISSVYNDKLQHKHNESVFIKGYKFSKSPYQTAEEKFLK